MKANEWMRQLDDGLLLQNVSIPGTHDSCALHGGDLAQCQTLTLDQQLNGGIRFLDIRCRHIDDRFAIHHGIVYQHLGFGDVRDACERFLDENPSECIVMLIKKEGDTKDCDRHFYETFEWYLRDDHRAYWWSLPDAANGDYLGNRVPTVGEARGKIVLIRRFNSHGNRMGLDASDWQDDDTFQTGDVPFWIQDEYHVPTLFNIDDKWDKVHDLLRNARDLSNDYWFLNYTSGTSSGAYPNAVAKGSPGITGVNKFLHDYLKDHKGEADHQRVGTMVMDFPEWPDESDASDELVGRIVLQNFQ